MDGRWLWTGRPSTRPQDIDINGDFSEFEDVVELIESLEVAPDPQVRAAHIRSAAEASGLPLQQRLGVAGVPLTRILGRAAAVVLILAISVSALGAAAALPEPLQDAVTTVAEYFGIDMPPGVVEDSEPEPLPTLDEDSPTIDQPFTTSVVEDNDGETDGASPACEDPRYESDDECVDVDDDEADDDEADDDAAVDGEGDGDKEDEAKEGDDEAADSDEEDEADNDEEDEVKEDHDKAGDEEEEGVSP